ncbi:MAG: RsmE family RNA methyltransferase [Candidatus Gracilibacteria bacterium]
MKQIQHFFIDSDLNKDEIFITDKELIHQIKNVLRFRTNDECILLDNKGAKAQATVTEIHKDGAGFTIKKREFFDRPSRTLRLYIAIPKKPATLEMIIQKATEIGATEIIPLDTLRCQVHSLYKTDRLKFIAKEASEQCERMFMPELGPLLKFAEFIQNPPDGIILAGDATKYDKKLCEINLKNESIINIVIGPEGGLTDEELDAISKIGGTLFVLGETVLRMETAMISALSVVQFG